MGLSFRNLQIYNPGHVLKYNLEEEYAIIYLTEDWDTIVEDDIFVRYENITEEAAILSGRIDLPVISLQYVDDDYLALDIFKNSVEIAHYYVGIDDVQIKNASEIIKTLHVESSMEIVFRKMLKKVKYATEAAFFINHIAKIPVYSYSYSDEPNSYKFLEQSEVLEKMNSWYLS